MVGKKQKSIILGGGISGLSAKSLLERTGKETILVDRKEGIPDSETSAREILNAEEISEIIKSPGIPPSHPWLVLARERNIPVESEIDLARHEFSGKILGITGTDGKSTTTALTHHLIQSGFPDSEMGGNIGRAFSDFCQKNISYAVLELSSYQLEDSKNLEISASTILNLAEDHIERHGSMEAYIQAKCRIVDWANPDHKLIIDPTTWKKISFCIPNRYSCQVEFYGEEAENKIQKLNATIQNSTQTIQTDQFQYNYSRFPLAGQHNIRNLTAAILLAESTGMDPTLIQNSIPEFRALSHRFENFYSTGKWKFINDSKSTNLHSLMAWLSDYKETENNLHLILGGRPKKESIRDLVQRLEEMLCQVYVYGEASQIWKEDLRLIGNRIHFLERLEDSLALIKNFHLQDPEIPTNVVLSPACASFDQFKNFEERGNQFKNLTFALFGNPE